MISQVRVHFTGRMDESTRDNGDRINCKITLLLFGLMGVRTVGYLIFIKSF